MGVREFVEIVIKQKGAKATVRGIKSVGRAGATAAKGLGGLALALGAVGGAAGFILIAKNAIQASAAMEGYGIRLAKLLGSQEQANKSLNKFVELSAKTPFAVKDIIAGAATLGSAALGNSEKLERLTQTAANLAAATGLSFQDAAQNLARSLNAGIGAADQFRDRGITPLIEKLGGVADASKLTSKELDALFDKVFGAGGGIFGTAAEDLSNTLGGALSNIGDAAGRFSTALGNAFSPAVINLAKQALIPFLTELEKAIKENKDEIAEFAAGALKAVAIGLANFSIGSIKAVAAVNRLGLFIDNLVGGFKELQLQLAVRSLADYNKQLAVGGIRAEFYAQKVKDQNKVVNDLRAEITGLSDKFREGTADADKFDEQVKVITDRLEGLKDVIENTDFSATIKGASADIDLSGAGDAPDPAVAEAAATAAKARLNVTAQLAAVTDRLKVAEIERLEPLNAQLRAIDEQRQAVIAQADAIGDIQSGEEALGLLADQRARIEQTIADEEERQALLMAEIAAKIEKAALVSPILAAEIQKAADAAHEAGGGLERVNNALEQVGDKASTSIKSASKDANRFGQTLSRELERGIGSAVRGALTGEGLDAAELFADIAANLISSALNDAFSKGFGGAGGGLGSLFGGGGEGGEGGGSRFDIQAGIQAGLTATTLVLAGALKGTTSAISNNLIKSAASQSEAAATRGVIAGPTSVPIFQVGQQLDAAMRGTESRLDDILAAILDGNTATAGGGGGGLEIGVSIEDQVPSLIS